MGSRVESGRHELSGHDLEISPSFLTPQKPEPSEVIPHKDQQTERPIQAAVVHGSSFQDSAMLGDSVHSLLENLFSPLKIRVYSVLELGAAGMRLLTASCNVVGLIGDAGDFTSRDFRSIGKIKRQDDTDCIVLSFAPKTRFKDAARYLKVSDSVIFCDTSGTDWILDVSQIVYHFFESLMLPSLLNIDPADVRRIAQGIGLAFNFSEDDPRKIISRLPKECLVARSALLHFSCKQEVMLREVYNISKSIALKKGELDPELNSHSDAKNVIRNVNVKIGIRLIDDSGEHSSITHDQKRIGMTAVFFGL
jgi:hypothetical protein